MVRQATDENTSNILSDIPNLASLWNSLPGFGVGYDRDCPHSFRLAMYVSWIRNGGKIGLNEKLSILAISALGGCLVICTASAAGLGLLTSGKSLPMKATSGCLILLSTR